MQAPCKHPIVKVVSRQQDAEFVECQQCGEIFDSAEYEDMAAEDLEDQQLPDAEEPSALKQAPSALKQAPSAPNPAHRKTPPAPPRR